MTFYLETRSTDPRYNLAFEEYVLKKKVAGDWLILWQNENAVILGRNQNALEEINREFVEAHGISVVRRNTGGGAVYHDLGNLNYSFITDHAEGDTGSGNRFSAAVAAALREMGLDASCSGRNDILISGQKISGTAQHRCGGRILHHGTLLFDSDPERIAGSLNPDPTKFQSKSVKSVRSRVGNIRPHLRQDMTLPQFWERLKAALGREGMVPIALTPAELAEIRAIQEEKYDTWQWNFGSAPKFDTLSRRRFSGGLLEIRLTVRQGKIGDLRIFGDFLALRPVEELIAALVGLPYRRAEIEKALAPLPLADYLGSITRAELLQVLMNE